MSIKRYPLAACVACICVVAVGVDSVSSVKAVEHIVPKVECASRLINVGDFNSAETDDGNVQIALAHALECGASLFFPPGTWQLRTTLNLNPVQGSIEVFGAGNTSILEFSSGGAITSDSAILIGENKSTNGVYIHDLALRNLGDLGYGVRSFGKSGTSTTNLQLSRLNVQNFRNAQIKLHKDYNSHIADNYLIGGDIGLSVGEEFSIGSWIENNWARGWQRVGIQVGSGSEGKASSAMVIIEDNIVDQGSAVGACSTFNITNYQNLMPKCPVGIQVLSNTANIQLSGNHLEQIRDGIGIYVEPSNNTFIGSNHVYSHSPTKLPADSDSYYGIYYSGIGQSALLMNNTLQGFYRKAAISDLSTFPGTVFGQTDANSGIVNKLTGKLTRKAGVTRHVTAVDFGEAHVLGINDDWDIIEASWSTVSGPRVAVYGIGSRSEETQVGREVTFVFQDCNVRLYGRFDGGNTSTPFRLKESSTGMWGSWDPGPYDSITFVKVNGIDSLEKTRNATLNSTSADQVAVWLEVSRREIGMPCP